MPDVYHMFKGFGKSSITGSLDSNLKVPIETLITEVLRIYGNLDGVAMSMLTHKEGTPWHEVWNGGLGKGLPISSDRIHQEFSKLRVEATS